MIPPDPTAGTPEPPRAWAAALMGDWSIEATLPKADDLAALRSSLPPGRRVYLSALPHVPPRRLADHAMRVAEAGFEPVPHLAVRNFRSRGEAAEFLGDVRERARVRRVLVVAGDRERSEGPFGDSLQLIVSGLLREAGMEAIDVAGYPDGHPKISANALMEALRAKIAAARRAELDVGVVTQFGFDAAAMLRWLGQLRGEFPQLPVRMGLAGPAGAKTLFKYALRCGVRTSIRGLTRGLHLLADNATPAKLVHTLAEGRDADDGAPLALHFYSFGGIGRTAQWARDLAEGEIELG